VRGKPLGLEDSVSGWNDRTELEQQTEVVARGPVLRDLTIGDAEDVDVLYRIGLSGSGFRD